MSTSPVVVVSGSDLILYVDGKRKHTQTVIPPIFHSLKAVAHTPFTIYLRLSSHLDTPFDGATIDSLRLVEEGIGGVERSLGAAGFTAAQLDRQREILSRSSALLKHVLEIRTIDRSTLGAYAADLGPKMLANAGDAGCAQIRATDKQMTSWKAEMTPTEWDSLIVMVRGKHQARYRNAATQYFAWLLGTSGPDWSYPGESMRVVFTEFLGKGEDSRDLLGTVLVDADASQSFFGDRWRLTVDILADGASDCISRLRQNGAALAAN